MSLKPEKTWDPWETLIHVVSWRYGHQYVWGVAINCFSGPVSFVALFPQAHRGESVTQSKQQLEAAW